MTRLKPTIRRATPADIDTLVSFNCRLATETEDKTLDPEVVRRGVQRGIQISGEVTYYMAEVDSKNAGTLMLTREWSDWRNGWVYWLQSVYVHREFRGRGVFRSLMDHVTESLNRDPDTVGLRLYVEANNLAAQDVYRACGFAEAGYRVMERFQAAE